MSARQAKRLGNLAAKDVEDESESEEELEEKRPANVGFAFLADSDSDSDESSQEEEEDAVDKEETTEQFIGDDDEEEDDIVVVKEPPKPTKGKKKNKKKNRGGNKSSDAQDVDEEDVDQLLDALTAKANDLDMDASTSARNENEKTLFGVQLNFINADREMKRIFGVKDDRESSSNRQRVDPRNVARKTTKKVFMITPHDEWPRPPTFVGGGIRWTRANKPKGPNWSGLCNYFEITWSIAYKKSQEEFEILQQTHDPNLIGHFLRRYPYHIDALLQMSEVFQHHGQMDHAADCIKRCMYALELAWAGQFDVTTGNCRMDMRTEHNDGFFRTLFLLMKQVGRRGCVRSAFETAKLLLGLDPQGDPINVLLAIDYYALTSRQCQFVIDLTTSNLEAVDRFDSSNTDSKKPSGGKSEGTKTQTTTIAALPNLQFSVALAHYFLGNSSEAKEYLAIALLKYPTMLKPLLDKIAVNTSSSSWQPILASRLFANAKHLPADGVLQHLLDIYVTRNHSLWKVNDVQMFLLRSAQHALASPALFSAYPQVMELPTCLSKYRRAIINDYSDEITTLPADHPMLQPPQLPNGQPIDAEMLAQLAQAQEQLENGNLRADANPLLLFLQTLLPWNHVQGANPPAPDQE